MKYYKIEFIIKELLIKALDDKVVVFKALERFPVYCLFPTQNKLIVKVAQLLQKVLHTGNISRQLEDHKLCLCYKMRWLHSKAMNNFATNILCVFISKLYKK